MAKEGRSNLWIHQQTQHKFKGDGKGFSEGIQEDKMNEKPRKPEKKKKKKNRKRKKRWREGEQ